MGWCPACREWTVLDPGQPCAWCGTRVVEKRGGWKRPDLTGRISEPAARAIHAKYQTGISANRLGKALYQTLGYTTPASCANAIGDAFRRHPHAMPGIRVSASGFGYVVEVEGPSVRVVVVFVVDRPPGSVSRTEPRSWLKRHAMTAG